MSPAHRSNSPRQRRIAFLRRSLGLGTDEAPAGPLRLAVAAVVAVFLVLGLARWMGYSKPQRVQAVITAAYPLADFPLTEGQDPPVWMPTTVDVYDRAHKIVLAAESGLRLREYSDAVHLEVLPGGGGYLVWTSHHDRRKAETRVTAWIQASRELVIGAWLAQRARDLPAVESELNDPSLGADRHDELQALLDKLQAERAAGPDRIWSPSPVGLRHEGKAPEAEPK